MPESKTTALQPMSITDIVRLLLRRWPVILVSTVLVMLGVYGVVTTRTPVFTATTSEYFAVSSGGSGSDLAQGSNYLQDQMASFGQLATAPLVLNAVIDDLGLPMTARQLARSITVTTPRNTVVMRIDVQSADPQRAATIANAVARELTTVVGTLSPKLASGRPLVTVQSIQNALPPTVQSAPNKRRDVGLGLLGGLIVSSIAVIAVDRLDRRVRTVRALAELTQVPLLGVVRRSPALARGVVVGRDMDEDEGAEDLRNLRIALEKALHRDDSAVVVVTSPLNFEGRSTIAANLAAAFVESGRRCVLVDADLQAPTVATRTGVAPGGLETALVRPEGVLDVVTASNDLPVLTAGAPSVNPTRALSSSGFAAVLEQLRGAYDLVLLDAAPLVGRSGAGELAGLVDGALVVVDARSTKAEHLEAGLEAARAAKLEVIGIVLNEVLARDLPAAGARRAARRARQRTSIASGWRGSTTAVKSHEVFESSPLADR